MRKSRKISQPIKMVKRQTISAGEYHSLVVDREGQIWSFGNNFYGQLGRSPSPYNDTPTRIPRLPFIINVSAGRYHSLALDENGQVWVFGNNNHGQLGLPNPRVNGTEVTIRITPAPIEGLPFIIGISAGEDHSLLLDQQGRVWAFGNNNNGYLGLDASRFKLSNTASSVQGGLDAIRRGQPTIVGGLPFIVGIAAGSNYSLVLARDGQIWSFGHNRQGQLGLGDTKNRGAPSPIEGLPFITSISAGSQHGLALDRDNQVWSFGANLYGQLGLGDTKSRKKPVSVMGLPLITNFSTGPNYSLVVDRDGQVWTFGRNIKSPIQISGLSSIINVTAGSEHMLALDVDGRVWSRGNNFYGQLGVPRLEPEDSGDDNEEEIYEIPGLIAQIPPEDIISPNTVQTVYPLMKLFISPDFRINSQEGEDTIIEFDVDTTTYVLRVKYDAEADLIDEPVVSDEDKYINLFNDLLENNELQSSIFHPEFYQDEEGNQALEFEDITGQRYLIRAHP